MSLKNLKARSESKTIFRKSMQQDDMIRWDPGGGYLDMAFAEM